MELLNEFDQKYNIVDEPTPPDCPLSGIYKQSFAYYTIRERLPVILTQIVDQLSKDKDELVVETGTEGTRNDIKEVQGAISQLKYELQTDKKLTELFGDEADRDEWNVFLELWRPEHDSYFTASWLYTECYMYRRLKSIFEKTKYLHSFDYFGKQKRAALIGNYPNIQLVVRHVADFMAQEYVDVDLQRELGFKLLKLSMWGNRCDLSISLGRQVEQQTDPFTAIESLDKYLLVDKFPWIWDALMLGKYREYRTAVVDIVLDNAGYELFTDLMLAHFLITYNFVKCVRFHVKAIPWFISDVTHADFEWTLRELDSHADPLVAAFGRKLGEYVRDRRIELLPMEWFWTGPFEFYRMSTLRPSLYAELAKADLVIFKGDLNYRKLLGDFNWDFESPFDEVLRGFRPAHMCSLRTVKADIICELKPGVADELKKEDPMWMETGKYAVAHFARKNPK